MANGLDALVGTLPVILVGGMAMNMTERMMSHTRQSRKRTSVKRRRTTRAYTRRSSSLGFGDFSNLR